ncbi:MAG: 3-hydroxyacyl-ACP dehydratase FabZ [Gammaproteobacteria bacterium]|jgi:3-hydroxyacyl-[acyl-carrier-protein] dehydratase
MSEVVMDINKIMEFLPHRYPFLLVDRVIEMEELKRLVGIKNVTINEHFFNGHFPVKPVMPGVLIIEALAQCTGLLAMASQPDEVPENSLYYFVGIDKARFKRTVEPGDQLLMEVDFIKHRRSIWVFNARATVDGQLAAQAEIMCTAREI